MRSNAAGLQVPHGTIARTTRTVVTDIKLSKRVGAKGCPGFNQSHQGQALNPYEVPAMSKIGKAETCPSGTGTSELPKDTCKSAVYGRSILLVHPMDSAKAAGRR